MSSKKGLEEYPSLKPNLATNSKPAIKADQLRYGQKISDVANVLKASEAPEKRISRENPGKVLVEPPQDGEVLIPKMKVKSPENASIHDSRLR